MVPRKRAREEMEETSDVPAEPSLLTKLRNMWEFAAFMQYIFIFGKAVKIDEDFDIEVPYRPYPSHPVFFRCGVRRSTLGNLSLIISLF